MLKTWEATYATKGVVQTEVLSTVRTTLGKLHAAGCRSVLDLCCGSGRHTELLAANGFAVTGIDESATAIRLTQQRLLEAQLPVADLHVADMRATGLPSGAFDALLCVWSTGHGYPNDLDQTIAEMARVLRPGGLLFADFPSTVDGNCGRGIKVACNTWLHPFLDHADVPHYYCETAELRAMLLRHFAHCTVQPVTYPCQKYNTNLEALWVEAQIPPAGHIP